MKPSLSLFVLIQLAFLFSLFHFTVANFSSSKLPLCHGDERSALLQFKENFIINKSVSSEPSAYPKVELWKPEGGSGDCCSWDGIECDKDTGHVISLDLTSSCLYGSINSNSTLFRLVNLEWLSLTDNHFNYSEIPSGFGNLLRLSHLNLSFSAFSGQIPSEILGLSKLVSLDLSYNPLKLQKPGLRSLAEKLINIKELHLSGVNISSTVPHILANLSSLTSLLLSDCGLHGQIPSEILELSKLVSLDLANNPLKLQKPGLRSLAEKLTNIKELYLSGVNISSTVPHNLANLSSLTSLLLRDCGLYGEFPTGIFQLPNLQFLSVRFNPYLTGYLPAFPSGSPLEDLRLSGTSFFGELPDSIGNLKSLNNLVISDCHFSGSIPSSLGSLNQLTFLDLSFNNFSGQIPSSFANYTKLTVLYLHYNNLTGQIPTWLGNLTQLTEIKLEGNKFHGRIPRSIFSLVNVEVLYLHENNLSGEVKFDLFSKLKNLHYLQLSSNNLSLITKPSFNVTFSKFKILGLMSCNLNEFPDFLQNQDELEVLILSNNKIHGQIPKWMWNLSKKTLLLLCLDSNFLEGFDQSPVVLPWSNLGLLDLSNNIMKGSLPIPPPSIITYIVSNNRLTGKISPFICSLTSVIELDLSNNNLGGMPPQCLGNLSNSLYVLDLGNNNFRGNIPQTYIKGCKLRVIDFSQNQLQGKVPRSLANCTMLESINLGNNQIKDTFPSWLGTLAGLKVLILRSNEFYSAIEEPKTTFEFPMLRIVDLSDNSFTGKLPSQHFQMWNAMKNFYADRLRYLAANTSFKIPNYSWSDHFGFSMTITNKGTETYYERIQEFLVVIDLSSNRFEGHIPEDIGNLKGLCLLNLSNNILTGHIPSSFENLTELESLDLSQNKLSGEIPPQLAQLTFLAFLNVSHNRLMGPIPHGNQFDTFQNNSFEGNPGLCGNPLLKKCGVSSPPPSSTAKEDESSSSPFEFDWKVVLMGYACGLVVGVFVGYTVITKKHEWFAMTFGMRQQKMRRVKRRGHQN